MSILVGVDEVKSCPKGSPAAAGIGTYAYLCSVNPSSHDSQPMISGAVREKHFAVVMAKEAGLSGSTSSGPAVERLKQISEMIAGNLF